MSAAPSSQKPSPGRVYIGTSGWAYTSWKPGFYPSALPAKQFLAYYATRLNSVEVNYTFRCLPTAEMLDGWLSATDESFRFSFKAPQRITHTLRLKDCAGELAAFTASLEPVVRAGRMGLVLLQLPPNFKADVGRLDDFCAAVGNLNPAMRMAFEFRHSSWFAEEAYAALRRRSVALCVAESDELETPDVVTAPFRYYRLRKTKYDARKMAAVAGRLAERTEQGEIFAYFKHEEEPTGALRAVQTLRRLNRAGLAKVQQGRSRL